VTPRAWAALFAVGGIWGASFLFIEVALEQVAPLQIVLFRTVGGASVLVLMIRVRHEPLRLTPWLALSLVALSLVSTLAPLLLITWAQTRIDSGTAAILNALMPIFTLLLAAVAVKDERFSARALGGAGLGVLGVALLSGGAPGGFDGRTLAGEGAVILAVLGYAAGNIMVRSLVRSLSGVVISGLQIAISAAIALAASLLLDPPRFDLRWDVWGSLLCLAIFGTGAAYIAYYWLIEHAGSFRSSLVTYIIPVVGVILGAGILDEPVTAATVAGGILIGLGVALGTGALEQGLRAAFQRPATALGAEQR
jgi:drug/metabolite transporter (DMT)-like permease